jgi:uncharacterized protein
MTPSKKPSLSVLRGLIACLCGLALMGGCAVFEAKQGEWIFNPSERSWGAGNTSAEGLRNAWIEFPSAVTGKRTKLHLVIAGDSKGSKPVLLYLHGARWNLSGSTARMQRMHELGFTVVAVDYRGFGQSSEESPSEDKAYEDARAAWDWIARQYPQQDRYLFGHSLGGAIAIELASQVNDERGTIVEGTFTSIPDVFSTLRWGWLPVGWMISQRFDSESKVANIGSPLLMVHGSEDKTIRLELGQKLYKAASNPKRFILVQGGSHHNTNGLAQPLYRQAMREMFGLGS